MFLDVHVTKRRSDWPELFGMARTKEGRKESAQRYQTTLSAAILLAEVVGWERDYSWDCDHYYNNVNYIATFHTKNII